MLPSRPISVLHVEVGGRYGGSLRALELYLAHSQRSRFLHDVLFYYPTPGAERLRPLARRILTLYEATNGSPLRSTRGVPDWLRTQLRGSALAKGFNDLRGWVNLANSMPTVYRLSRILGDGSYDVIHINNTLTYQAPTVMATKSVGMNAVAHVRNPIRNNALTRWLLSGVHSIVTINRTLETELRSWGIPMDIRTCYDAVEPPSADPSASHVARASLAPRGTILVGSVGR